MRRVTLQRIALYTGLVISLVAMVMLFSRISWSSLAAALARISPAMVLYAVILTLVSYVLRALRWRYLLPQGSAIPFSVLMRATILGYMGNTLLPARLGELVRVWSLARSENRPISSVLASLVTDRLWDGLSVVCILIGLLVRVTLPPAYQHLQPLLIRAGVIMSCGYIGLITVLWWVRRSPEVAAAWVFRLVRPISEEGAAALSRMMVQFSQSIRFSRGDEGGILPIILTSFFIWLTATVPIHLVILGSGYQLPFSASVLILVLLVFAVMVPAAPGAIGTFHIACAVGLSVYGIEPSAAVSLSLVLHACGCIPVTIIGLFLLWHQGISLKELYHEVEDVQP